MKKWFFALLVLSLVSLVPLQAQTQPPGGTPPPGGSSPPSSGGSGSGTSGQYSNSVITLTGGTATIAGQQNTPSYAPDTSSGSLGYGRNNSGSGTVTLSGAVTPHWKWNSTTSPPPPKILVIYDVSVSHTIVPDPNSPVAGTGDCSDGFGDVNRWEETSLGNVIGKKSHHREYKIVTTDNLTSSTVVAGAKVLPSISPSANVKNGASSSACTVWIKVTAVPAYESGTNCNFTFVKPAGVADVPVAATLTSATVKLGTETVSSSVADWSGTPKTIRYMSNHFADDSEIPLEIAYTVSFDAGTLSGGGANNITKTFTETIKRVSYNKYSLTYTNAIDFVTGFPGFKPIDGKIPTSIDAMKQKELNVNDRLFVKTKFLDYLSESTLVYFALHGHLNPDIIGGTTNPGILSKIISPTEIETARHKYNWKPPINIVYAVSCWTANTTTFPNAFGFQATSTPPLDLLSGWKKVSTDNRAYIGWDRVATLRVVEFTVPLFWQALQKGLTVNEARDIVQTTYKTESKRRNLLSFNDALCVGHGDPSATLNVLYKAVDKTKWFELSSP
jgi:hypothetical protein